MPNNLHDPLVDAPVDLFIVEQRDKPHVASGYRPGSSYLAETNITDATEATTIRDLMNAQFDDRAVKVYRLVDVTADFRAKLQNEINRSHDGLIPDWLSKFMEE